MYRSRPPDLQDIFPADPVPNSELNFESKRAQVDTAAMVSCTNDLSIIHHYKPYTDRKPSPVRLKAAIKGQRYVVPLGHGYIRCPSPHGFADCHVYYSPQLTGTLLSPEDVIKTTPEPASAYRGQVLYKWYPDDDDGQLSFGNMTLVCYHKRVAAKDIVLHGRIIGGQTFTHPLILPDHPASSLYASVTQSIQEAKKSDKSFATTCINAVCSELHHAKLRTRHELGNAIRDAPHQFANLNLRGIKTLSEASIPVYAIKADTEKLLWHQRLNHCCDDFLYSAHNHIDGVPKFCRESPVLNQCPTCIQAKLTKTPPGHNSTKRATRPYQGLSIDFAFAGIKSKNSSKRQDYEGINGETCWILITDHFTGIKHGDTRISKAAPLRWLAHFLAQYSPTCNDKYVHMDQGGELYNNIEVRNLFEKKGYKVFPTGADSSHQNGPVERGHRTLGDAMRAMLLGANLDAKFWPYAFYHALRTTNALPSKGSSMSPITLATGKREDFTNFRTFGCRVWVRPPTGRTTKLRSNARKGLFLGYVPYTTRNILWYDVETNRVKIASHARFDEGMNDLAVKDLPPNVAHLQRRTQGEPLPIDDHELSSDQFHFTITPFANLLSEWLKHDPKSTDSAYGFTFADDELLQKPYIADIAPKSPASKLRSSHKATLRKLRGAFVMEINHERVFTAAQAVILLAKLHTQGVEKDIPITLAIESKPSAQEIRRRVNDFGLFAPNTKWDENENTVDDPPFLDRTPKQVNQLHANIQSYLAPDEDDMDASVPTLDLHSLRCISRLRNPELSFEEDDISSEMIELAINAIRSSATTPEEQALGFFTRKKLKQMDTWDIWKQGECEQLEQFHDLQMFGQPIVLDDRRYAIILRPHWQYHIKRCGKRRARLCCNGSKRAAPLLHQLTLTYSSCVEHPVQRLFFAIAASLDLKVYGGDAKDAYAHSPGPELPTYMTIDDAFAEWYQDKFSIKLDRKNQVLPVLRALQGHPESGRLWEMHINKILTSPELDFKTTTHDKTIYKGTFDGETVYLLRQVDDFAMACTNLDLANKIYDIIGQKLQLPKETKVPFAKLGLIDDFNGIDVLQTNRYTQLSCSSYIDRLITSHGWQEDRKMKEFTKPMSPISSTSLLQIFSHKGPKEGTKEHQEIEEKNKFSYRTLLGEMMYAYVTCRPDIGYAITLLSKFGSCPSEYHYSCLKNIARYLRSTKHWGIRYSRSHASGDPELTPVDRNNMVMHGEENLPQYPADITQPKLICFVDAAYGNNLPKRRSTTGYAFTYAGGAIVYRSKTQSVTALRSTEAEFYAAVTAAKTARFLQSLLSELGFPQLEPTPIYKDNQPAINIIKAIKPTERNRHIEI